MTEENKTKTVHVCYLDDNDDEVKGYFELIKQSENYVQIKSGKNIITLPYHRIKKIKEKTKIEDLD